MSTPWEDRMRDQEWSAAEERRDDAKRRLVEFAVEMKEHDRVTLLKMLKKTTLGLRAICTLNADIGPKARKAAADLAQEAEWVIKACESREAK